MPFEKPQKGNPHQFVIQQHFHTAHCIGKFNDADEKVEVKFVETGDIEKKGKRSKIFCAKRNWDEKAERGLMGDIEDDFHEEINNMKSFENRNHSAISEYFLLWRIRHQFYKSPMQDITLNGISGSGVTTEEEEILESKGAMFVRDGGKVPSRFMTGMQVLMQLDQQRSGVKDLKWGLLEAKEGEFIVADCYQDLTLMPISPKLAFCADYKDSTISKADVSEINKQSISKATDYYFAKNMALCPVA
ncbi:hypothetical protein GCM10007978_00180 [Shewanella hanedai]|uniref:DUF4238 domain-containing protein n=1 Tax=Shewanella hanedai TaxID=25 RepID=A0A553JUK4_SHEHA|nr:hypothetical protein [Shewanella hanedai]TRY16136.1 hypothetical protein FN961_00450 [Shewanella hanedai]GGI66937.1 hypothetical protein GCM10007978_00180 [Shewanella hanedai]